MATIAVFEDDAFTYDLVNVMVYASEHAIIGAASSTREAHVLLTRMALGEVAADYTLVDANLTHNNAEDFPYPAFRLIRPGTAPVVQPVPKRFRRKPKPVPNPAEIVVEHEGPIDMDADGRFILRVLKACEIDTTTINISLNPANVWDRDRLIHYDLTKLNLVQLIDVIDELEASK